MRGERMVENAQSTEKKELTEIFCLRLNLEQKRYKKRMLKMNPEAVFGKAYEINCMLSIYETLIEKSEKMETDILKCLLVIPDILHFFYRRWMKTGDSFQMELENSMEQGLKEIEAMLNITEEKAA
ncbi:MAG: DUF3848 domain-containing protein [Eubacteriales bacterium]|nr:DUF3848 domain-containing protein [Eubacteriales bacterium]